LVEPSINNADSSRMGKAAEHLIAAACIIQSRAVLNVSTSLVDDEGVDLVFHRRGGTATLAVQVKARFSDSKSLARGRFLQNVRSVALRPRSDLYVLFVAVDVVSGLFDTCWLVPSVDLAATARRDRVDRYRFSASTKPASRDRWRPYRLTRVELPGRILSILGSA
jgi:hypothetical protein